MKKASHLKTMTEPLAPCKHCGSEAHGEIDEIGWTSIVCPEADCEPMIIIEGFDKEWCIDVWNYAQRKVNNGENTN